MVHDQDTRALRFLHVLGDALIRRRPIRNSVQNPNCAKVLDIHGFERAFRTYGLPNRWRGLIPEWHWRHSNSRNLDSICGPCLQQRPSHQQYRPGALRSFHHRGANRNVLFGFIEFDLHFRYTRLVTAGGAPLKGLTLQCLNGIANTISEFLQVLRRSLEPVCNAVTRKLARVVVGTPRLTFLLEPAGSRVLISVAKCSP